MIITTYLKYLRGREKYTTANDGREKSIFTFKVFHMKDGITYGERPRSEGMNGYVDVIGNVMCHSSSPFSLVIK